MDTRRLFVALGVALAVYLVYTTVYNRLRPPPKPSRPPPQATTQPLGPAMQPTTEPVDVTTRPAGAPTATREVPAADFSFVAAPEVERLSLGGGPNDRIQVELTSDGAAIETIKLTARKKDGQYVHRQDIETNEPYALIKPVPGPEGSFYSYLTQKIWLGKRSWELDRLVWDVLASTPGRAVFAATLRSVDGSTDRLRVTKTYELDPKTAQLQLRLGVENLSDTPFTLQVEQDGPVGIVKEHLQYDMRRLVVGRWDGQRVDAVAKQRKDLAKQETDLGSSKADKPFMWTALGNKYFAVYTRPLPRQGPFAEYVEQVEGTVAVPDTDGSNPGDLLARIRTSSYDVAPGTVAEYVFEVHAGTKNERDLEKANPAFADRKLIGYVAARDADRRCCCTFPFLTSLATWMLEKIQVGVRNYGVAIIVLVLMIRALLHPLTVFQQKSMYRMQEAQARLAPKISEIKEKYRNDRTKQNQETMKLYSEEGVNPMAGLIGMLPLAIQMPILVALWTALNTDVHLRHAGFDPWWITDLSAPDALVEFGGKGVTLPILSLLPMIGSWFQNIPSLNLLPILMGVSMWLQQKYMPKPGMQAKLAAAKKATAEKKPHHKGTGMSPEDQLRQQQMIAYMMSIMFPLMFYYWPSGLNLYWMSTNVFGIAESLVIRRQLKQEKERREREGPQPGAKKKIGVVGQLFKRLAARVEEVQKKADHLSKDESKRSAQKGPAQRKR